MFAVVPFAGDVDRNFRMAWPILIQLKVVPFAGDVDRNTNPGLEPRPKYVVPFAGDVDRNTKRHIM